MRAKKTTLLFVLGLLVILFCVALANIRYISTPRLVIKFHGRPLSNVTLLLPNGGDGPYQLDDDGSITARELGWRETSILVPFPDGSGAATVDFPKHGTKTVDFRGRMTTTEIVQYFGLVSNRYESFSYTDAEAADIVSGRRSSAEIVEEIRESTKQRGQSLDPSN
jgi:hypothetical protein